MGSPEKKALWLVTDEDGNECILWSAAYKANGGKALKKWRELSKREDAEAKALPLTCSVDGCYCFATDLLSGDLSGGDVPVPADLWKLAEVEVYPGDPLRVITSCPLCEKHARRFRRPLQKRIFRLEERLDSLQKSVKDIEYEQWT